MSRRLACLWLACTVGFALGCTGPSVPLPDGFVPGDVSTDLAADGVTPDVPAADVPAADTATLDVAVDGSAEDTVELSDAPGADVADAPACPAGQSPCGGACVD